MSGLVLNNPSTLTNDDGSDTYFQSDDRTTVEFKDYTGAYNSGNNTGGYGSSQTPTGKREVADIISSTLILNKPADTEDFSKTFNSGTTPTAVEIASQTKTVDIDNSFFDGDATEALEDGVYTGTYKVRFGITGTADYSSPDLVCNTGVWADYGVEVGSILEIGGVEYIVASVSTDTLQLEDEGALSGGSLTVYVVYISYFKMLLTKSVEKCWIESAPKILSKYCCLDCEKETVNNIMRFEVMITSSKSSYSCEDYTSAQNQIEYLTSLCNDSDICVSCN